MRAARMSSLLGMKSYSRKRLTELKRLDVMVSFSCRRQEYALLTMQHCPVRDIHCVFERLLELHCHTKAYLQYSIRPEDI